MSDKLAGLRNIGIIAHIDAGKTTLSERILYYTDCIHRMGEVHEGAATMDFMPEEQERGITIASACGSCVWNDTRINLIDTPGHVDFTIEVERSLRVLDGAVGVFCAVSGVEPQSETVWKQSEKFAVPKLAFINKMDRPGADFAAVLRALRERLGANPLALTIPLGAEEEFYGVIDLLHMESLSFVEEDRGRTVVRNPLTAEECELAAPWREALLDLLTEKDDILLSACLDGQALDIARAQEVLRRATLAGEIVPAFAGAALRNAGIQPLLDGIVAYLPSPADAKLPLGGDSKTGERVPVLPDPEAPLAALVFKVIMEAGRKLALLRIYAGSMTEAMACRNITTGEREKIGRIYRLQAGQRDSLPHACAGDIVAVQGLRSVRTGDSLAGESRPLLLENIDSYTPVISLALEAGNTEEGKKLDEALSCFCVEDPTLRVVFDETSGQRLVSGMGELHLDVLLERLKREHRISPRAGNPQVLCRESVQAEACGQGVFDRELGGQRHFGDVSVSIIPLPRGGGLRLCLPEQEHEEKHFRLLREALEQGLSDALQCGPLGYAVDDVAVKGSFAEEKRDLMTAPGCSMAAAQAVKNALQAASPLLLEPIMTVEITLPENMTGPVISLLNSRNGRVESIEAGPERALVRASAPMKELFGFSTALRSATQGRAGMFLRFARFDHV